MLYLTCTTITSVDLAHYGVSRAKDWVSVDCGTNYNILLVLKLLGEDGFHIEDDKMRKSAKLWMELQCLIC